MRTVLLTSPSPLVAFACMLSACAMKVDPAPTGNPPSEIPEAVALGRTDTRDLFPQVVKLFRLNTDGSLTNSCSGVLVSSMYVLTAKHCFNNINCGQSPSLSVTDNIQVNFGIDSSAPTRVAFHTNAISRNVLLRNDNPVDCEDGEEMAVHDLALVKLDTAIGFFNDGPIPVHITPTASHPVGNGLYCGHLVDNENAPLTVVGYGPSNPRSNGTLRNAHTGTWYTEGTSSCCAASNAFIWETSVPPDNGAIVPGDSGGGLFTTSAFANDTSLGGGYALCGINTGWLPQPPFGDEVWNVVSPVDREDNADWIHSIIDRLPNPNGRPDGGFQGEPLPREDIFARGTDGKLHYFTIDKFRSLPKAWRQVGSGNYGGVALTSEPSAVSWAPGRIDAFAINANDELVHAYTDDGEHWGWDPWGRPPASGRLVGVDVVSARPGRLDVFVVAGTTLYQRAWDWGDLGWKEWGSGTRVFLEAPGAAAGMSSPNRLDVFAVAWDIDGQFHIHKSLAHFYSDNGGSNVQVEDWGNGGFNLDAAKVDAASWGPGRLDVVAKAGGRIAHNYGSPTGWNEWGSFESPESSPTIVSMGPGILSEFHRSGGWLKSIRWAAPPGVTNLRVPLDSFPQSGTDWTPAGGIDASSW